MALFVLGSVKREKMSEGEGSSDLKVKAARRHMTTMTAANQTRVTTTEFQVANEEKQYFCFLFIVPSRPGLV